MSEQHLKLLRRQLSELEKVGSNPATQMEYSFGVEAWKSATITYSGDSRSRFPVISVHCLFKND